MEVLRVDSNQFEPAVVEREKVAPVIPPFLAAVEKIKEPEQRVQQQTRQTVLEQKACFLFSGYLPYEIRLLIFHRLDFNEQLRLMQTCKLAAQIFWSAARDTSLSFLFKRCVYSAQKFSGPYALNNRAETLSFLAKKFVSISPKYDEEALRLFRQSFVGLKALYNMDAEEEGFLFSNIFSMLIKTLPMIPEKKNSKLLEIFRLGLAKTRLIGHDYVRIGALFDIYEMLQATLKSGSSLPLSVILDEIREIVQEDASYEQFFADCQRKARSFACLPKNDEPRGIEFLEKTIEVRDPSVSFYDRRVIRILEEVLECFTFDKSEESLQIVSKLRIVVLKIEEVKTRFEAFCIIITKIRHIHPDLSLRILKAALPMIREMTEFYEQNDAFEQALSCLVPIAPGASLDLAISLLRQLLKEDAECSIFINTIVSAISKVPQVLFRFDYDKLEKFYWLATEVTKQKTDGRSFIVIARRFADLSKEESFEWNLLQAIKLFAMMSLSTSSWALKEMVKSMSEAYRSLYGRS